MQNKKTLAMVLLALTILFGLFLRAYHINQAPPGIYPDEAVNGIDAMTSNDSGHYKWFYPANQGREGLFINIQAFSLKYLGVSVFALKLPSIIIGTLTILGTFLLAMEIFSVHIGLLSSFLVATSFWAINFSRIGFRAIMLPFILVFAFYFLFRGLRTKKIVDFSIGGFIFGLGLHTYIAFRIAPVILVFALIALILSQENFLKNFWKHILAFVIFTSLAAAPMLYTLYVAHPEYAESRSSSISILSPQVNKGDLFGTFARSFGLSLAKYNFWGDQNWRHNYPPYPLLDPLAGAAFLFGFIYSIAVFFRSTYLRLWKKIRTNDLYIYTFLLIWFFAMLAPEFLTAEGNPHALRSIGTLPVVFIFSALTFDFILKSVRTKTVLMQKLTLSLVIAILISIGIFNSVKYHYFWASKTETARAFEKPLMEISAFIKNLPAKEEKFIVTGSMQRIPINLFSWKDPKIFYIYPGQIDQINPLEPSNFIIIMTEKNDDIISALQKRFPHLQLEEIRDSSGLSYYILK